MFLLITQNQFYRKAPHLVMLGHIYQAHTSIPSLKAFSLKDTNNVTTTPTYCQHK